MGCGCGSSTTQVTSTISSNNNSMGVKMVPSHECPITKADILKWQAIVQCLKDENKFLSADITEFNINQLLGVMQSALNYPENYCMYKSQLDYFKDTTLLKIVMNVPECIKG